MAELIAMRGKSDDIQGVLEEAKERAGECDSVVVLMQKKQGGIMWFAPNSMRFESLIFLLWSALTAFGNLK